jgi:hypothetical protein
MHEFYLTDEIIAELNDKLVGNVLAGAPTGFSAVTDVDHLGEEAIFVTLDLPADGKALEGVQYHLAHEIIEDAIGDLAKDRWIYMRLNYAKRLVA